jgi:hypothetical protein
MRIKSNIITIEYAGAMILQPGGHINGQEYGGSRSYSTTAEDVVDAATPTIRAYGNAQGSMNFDVCVDFESEGEAVAEAMQRMQHLDKNQTGDFTLTVGESVQRYAAGIQSADWTISYTVDTVRLTFSYSFILGASANDS